LDKVNVKYLEIGISITALVVFIALFSLVKANAGQYSNIAYTALFITFTVVICVIGLRLAPRSY
jgi:hypothetical protein